MLLKLLRLSVILLQVCALLAWSQQEHPQSPPPQVEPKPEFFAGTVTQLSSRRITISRQVAGHAPQHRTFVIDSKTKMPKSNLHLRSRVTVRFLHREEGDFVLAVKLQPPPRPAHTP
ncbi:MAG: hypothetical protein JO108_13765 [Acidobacteriaceae bacterium]|nr:hypothetical protein [Acidobacteriaceae bacterium]